MAPRRLLALLLLGTALLTGACSDDGGTVGTEDVTTTSTQDVEPEDITPTTEAG